MSAHALKAAHHPASGCSPSAPARGAANRGWRRLARAVLGLSVAATVLALAPNPAHGAAAVIDVDRHSGATRYETAAEIAEAYAEAVEDRGRPPIDTILLTSGADEHFGCALPAPALSRVHEAPLLLTEPAQLSAAVERFVNYYGIDRAFILGGTDVVSASVARELEAINNMLVTRVAGSDCYGTAVEVAQLVGQTAGVPGTYRREGRTALVATGEVFADALAAGPLAYRGRHPILLTPRDGLHQQVAQFLQSSRTQHVIILGGPAAVNVNVEQAIEQLGISVDRVAGADRHATAVRVAEELLGDRAPQVCFGGDEVGLAYGFKAPDAITSGPLLGELCAPLLLTDVDDLPASTTDILESDRYVVGDADGDLRITIFGGTAVVSRSVESQAVTAARLPEIRARISATEGACQFTVTFSEPVQTSQAGIVGNYTRGNQSLSAGLAYVDIGSGLSTSTATIVLAGGAFTTNAAVATGCVDPLDARERVGVIGGLIRGAKDKRIVQGTTVSVRSDNTRPTLTVSAPDGSVEVYVEVSEPVQPGSFTATFTRDRVASDITVSVHDGQTRFYIPLPATYTELKTGDRVVIPAGAVEDWAGNANLRTPVEVEQDRTLPRVRSVTATAPAARDASSVELAGRHNQVSVNGLMRIAALDGGAASGAAGNDWAIRVLLDDSLDAQYSPEVTVTSSAQRISVVASPGTLLGDLVDELNRHTRFNDLFEADLTAHTLADNATVDQTSGWVEFSGGTSSVDLTVNWTEPVQGCDFSSGLGLDIRLERIRVDADANRSADYGLDGADQIASGVEFVDAPAGNPHIVAGTAACDLSPGVMSGTLVARLLSENLTLLPMPHSRVYVTANAAYDLRGNPAANQVVDVRLQR